MIISSTFFSRTSLRALLCNSNTLKPGVSSIYIGAPMRSLTLVSSLFHSCLVSRPFLILSPSISQTFIIRRLTNCTLDISNENIATGRLKFTAIFFAMDNTKAVLPIAGRAAIIIRSDFCQPDVILSSSVMPLGTPDILPSFFAALRMRSNASSITGSIWVTSRFCARCEISKIPASASCINTSTSCVSSYPFSSIWHATDIRSRAVAF